MSPLVVLDTNVLVSGLLYPNGTPGKLVTLWRDGLLRVAGSKFLIDEAERILPKLSKTRVSQLEALMGLRLMQAKMDIFEPVPLTEPLLRDGNDQPVLGTLLASHADYLITGDKDLLALAAKYPILTPAEFWAKHG